MTKLIPSSLEACGVRWCHVMPPCLYPTRTRVPLASARMPIALPSGGYPCHSTAWPYSCACHATRVRYPCHPPHPRVSSIRVVLSPHHYSDHFLKFAYSTNTTSEIYHKNINTIPYIHEKTGRKETAELREEGIRTTLEEKKYIITKNPKGVRGRPESPLLSL